MNTMGIIKPISKQIIPPEPFYRMPTLNWIGKDKVVNYHLKVPYHVLERKYSFDEEGQHEEDNGSENMIIHGDNLLALKSLLPKYEGKSNASTSSKDAWD